MPALPGIDSAALHLVSWWMSQRYFRTFRAIDEPSAFDAILQQRDRRVGVTVGRLWDDAAPGAEALAVLLTSDIAADPAVEPGGYVVWVPPRVPLPSEEPNASNLRILLSGGLRGLQPGEHREVRLPASVKLAKIGMDGTYVSVSGGLSPEWLAISDGVRGAFHLDSRAIHRLPSERAEVDILLTQVKDRAAMLQPQELTDVALHDYWTVSRLPEGAPPGVTVIAAPDTLDPLDGAVARRTFRREVNRAVEQRRAAAAEGGTALSVLIVVAVLAHMEDEMVTASLRGMNPAAYGALDLIVLVADGEVRQVLQPRTLPWETQ